MTRTRHFHRTAVLVTASAIFAGTAGTAMAWGSTSSVTPVATTAAAPSAVSVDLPLKATVATARAVAQGVATAAPAPKPAAVVVKTTTTKTVTVTTKATTVKRTTSAATTTKASSSSPLVIGRYVDAPGSQAAIDKCQLVLWSHSPLWLAAHNYCGYQWLASVATGRTVIVKSGAAAGTYVVTGHLRLSRQGGAMPAVHADLVLQTCVGTGTGLTLLKRV